MSIRFVVAKWTVVLAGLVGTTVGAQPHKLQVADRAAAQTIVAKGGRLVADYGSFQLYSVTQPVPELAGQPGVEERDADDVIQLNAVRLDTTQPAIKVARQTTATGTGARLHLVQFVGPVKREWREQLEQAGGRVISYIPHNTYLVYGDAPSLARVQRYAATAAHIQWDGPYRDEYKIHPRTRTAGTDLFAVQLVADNAANAVTLELINRLKLAPVRQQQRLLQYRNVVVRLAPVQVPVIAARPDVVSIQPYFPRKKLCERQDQILAGNLSGNLPSGPGYLAWLASKGFTQAQFDASGFVVDVSDSGIDDGTTSPNHFGLYTLGNLSAASRVAYVRLEGYPNYGSTVAGCDGHGNLNAHIIGGYSDRSGFPFTDSSGFHYGLGVCPFVRLGSSVIFDPVDATLGVSNTDLESRAYRDGARISNNSWGNTPGDGTYDIDSQEFDTLVRDAQPADAAVPATGNQEMVIVFVAGNDGPSRTTINTPGTGKNIISVGGSENVQPFGGADGSGVGDTGANSANDVIGFSSRGPCADGRHKPDLLAPGTHVSGGVPQAAVPGATGTALTCYNGEGVSGGTGGSIYYPSGQQFYTASSGTSHAAPAVSGACALLRQDFINHGRNAPSAAMTKAYLINSARYLTGANAKDTLWSNNQGMGGLDLGMAFDGVPRLLRDQLAADKFTATGQTRTYYGTVADATQPFRVTLAWTDAPGSTTGSAWNNDLDLTVTVGGKTYKGNVFSGASSTTGGSADRMNNVESVFLPAGVTGNVVITISAANINSDGVPGDADLLDQDFALVTYNCTAPSVVLAGTTLLAESFAPTNGVIDPGETVTVNLALQDLGNSGTHNLVATLLATGGVTMPSGPQTYGPLAPGGAAVVRPFTFTATGACGDTVTATIALQDGADTLDTVTCNFPLGQVATVFAENFDGHAAPTLPDGWTTTASGSQMPWVTATNQTVTGPNAASAPDIATGVNELISPLIPIVTAQAQLAFQQRYDLLDRWDGGVLEIKLGSGAFTDILAAGGSFAAGGYNQTLFGFNPLGGRQCWSGQPGGFITTIVNLPAAAAGQTIQLRWQTGSSWGNGSWYIDNLTLTDTTCLTSSNNADLALAMTAAPAAFAGVSNVTYTLTVTNTGPNLATGVTATDTLPPGATLVSVTASQGTFTNLAGTVQCLLNSLAANASATVQLVTAFTGTGQFTNTATVGAIATDPNPTNNVASAVVSISCGYTLPVSSASIGNNSNSGGFVVNAPVGCDWTAGSTVGWLHTTSGGTGSGVANYLVDPNPTNLLRAGTITVAGQTYTVTQSGTNSDNACLAVFATNNVTISAAGGADAIGLIVGAGCTWSAVAGAAWIHASGGGNGPGTINYTVDANSAIGPRTSAIVVGSKIFVITQTGDTTPPGIVVTAPADSSVAQGTIVVSATATDNFSVARVEFYRDGGTLLGTKTAAPYTLNFDTTTVADGIHTISAKAFDAAGNAGNSLAVTVTVDNNPPTVPTGFTATPSSTNQIALSWNSSTDAGTGVAGYKLYRGGVLIAATNATHYLDRGLTARTAYCYAVAANDAMGHLSALSVPACAQTYVPAGSLLGTYTGLILQTNAPTFGSSGSIKIVLSKTGSFAANVSLGGVATAFKGQFDAAGNATNTGALRVVLHLDVTGLTGQITGTVGAATLLANRTVYSASNPCPLAGKYTCLLEPTVTSTNVPQGDGYATLTVAASGNGALAGMLADGTALSATMPVSAHGTWPLYKLLYASKGAAVGWLSFGPSNTVTAVVDWFKPVTSGRYAAGFNTAPTLTGTKLLPPAGDGTWQLRLTAGDLLSDIIKTVTVAAGKVTLPPVDSFKLSLKVTPAAGKFTGSFVHPVTTKPVAFTGLFLQATENDAGGFFLGPHTSGAVTLEP